MRNRASQSSDGCSRRERFPAAAILVGITAVAAAFFLQISPVQAFGRENTQLGPEGELPENLTEMCTEPEEGCGSLVLENVRSGDEIARYAMHSGDWFSVGFVHSVNKSPVTDYYELRPDGIYVVKTVYYGFGAGVQTELEEGQTLSYGEDGSMIITGFDRRMDDLIYIVGTVSDHLLTLSEDEKDPVSLRDLCGRNAMVRFTWYPATDQQNEGR